jgi:hypothetical protein
VSPTSTQHARTHRAPRRAVGLACLGASAVLVLLACSVGTGRGEAHGSLLVVDCGVDVPAYELQPTFFGADFVSDPEAAGAANPIVNLRVQRGSFREDGSDGLSITINDLNLVARERLGQPIDLARVAGEQRLVDMTFYASQTCESGMPDEFWRASAILPAVSGTITFAAVYAPDVDREHTEFRATFEDVRFESSERPDTRNATLSGFFEFVYQRGPPAQRFP